MSYDSKELETLVRKVVIDVLGSGGATDAAGLPQGLRHIDKSGIACVKLPAVKTEHFERAPAADYVQLKDVFTVPESPRLGFGVMELDKCDFEWTLTYDEIDYIIEGRLEIKVDNQVVAGANAGEIILIPKNSHIKFSSPSGFTRFAYVVYPANWSDLI
jgi:ethanolamine utilization protein EutQ